MLDEKKSSIWFAVNLCLILFFSVPSVSSDTVLRGSIRNTSGQTVSGAEVFVYNSSDVRRTPDFVSSPSDEKGRFSVVLPEGTYWVLARLRSGNTQWGPLMPGDKHSGEPIEVNVGSGGADVQFVVADLKEAAGLFKKKRRDDFIEIRGRIVDQSGKPAPSEYVVANRGALFEAIPDYVSAWSDDDGAYVLYLPPGRYFIGTASRFPPGPSYRYSKEVVFNSDQKEIDVVIQRN